jgi:hypothetical protein
MGNALLVKQRSRASWVVPEETQENPQLLLAPHVEFPTRRPQLPSVLTASAAPLPGSIGYYIASESIT